MHASDMLWGKAITAFKYALKHQRPKITSLQAIYLEIFFLPSLKYVDGLLRNKLAFLLVQENNTMYGFPLYLLLSLKKSINEGLQKCPLASASIIENREDRFH